MNLSKESAVAGVSWWRPALVAGVSLFMAGATYWRWWNLNKEVYFEWGWRRLPGMPLCGIALLTAMPIAAGIWMFHRGRSAWLSLLMLMLGMLALMIGLSAAQDTPVGLWRIEHVMLERFDSRYYQTASDLLDQGIGIKQLLAEYPHRLTTFFGHPCNKPPGILLFCMAFVERYGTASLAPRVCGILIGLIAVWIIPATYAFILYFTGNRTAAFMGAAFISLCPGPVLFFPMFDQWYPILTAAVTLTWAKVLSKGSYIWAAAFGVIYAFTLFVSYLPVVLGVFLLGYAAMKCLAEGWKMLVRTILMGTIAIGALILFYALLWVVFRFDPIKTFTTSLDTNHRDEMRLVQQQGQKLRRPPGTVPWDLYDFALGSGWISYLLLLYFFKDAIFGVFLKRYLAIGTLCVVQFVTVACIGLIPGETARVWMFMLPMLLLPIGLELSRWSVRARAIVFASLLLTTVVICQNLTFLV